MYAIKAYKTYGGPSTVSCTKKDTHLYPTISISHMLLSKINNQDHQRNNIQYSQDRYHTRPNTISLQSTPTTTQSLSYIYIYIYIYSVQTFLPLHTQHFQIQFAASITRNPLRKLNNIYSVPHAAIHNVRSSPIYSPSSIRSSTSSFYFPLLNTSASPNTNSSSLLGRCKWSEPGEPYNGIHERGFSHTSFGYLDAVRTDGHIGY